MVVTQRKRKEQNRKPFFSFPFLHVPFPSQTTVFQLIFMLNTRTKQAISIIFRTCQFHPVCLFCFFFFNIILPLFGAWFQQKWLPKIDLSSQVSYFFRFSCQRLSFFFFLLGSLMLFFRLNFSYYYFFMFSVSCKLLNYIYLILRVLNFPFKFIYNPEQCLKYTKNLRHT